MPLNSHLPCDTLQDAPDKRYNVRSRKHSMRKKQVLRDFVNTSSISQIKAQYISVHMSLIEVETVGKGKSTSFRYI